MKKKLIVAYLLSLLVGCSQQESPTGPEASATNGVDGTTAAPCVEKNHAASTNKLPLATAQLKAADDESVADGSLGTEVQPNWIVLPPAQNAGPGKTTSVSRLINGTDESLIEINTGYAGGPFGWISITANARFQRNSFTGQRYVTMSVNDEYGTATFSPSGTWSKPVIYNLTIQGIDLTTVDPSKVAFVYMAPTGKYYAAVCQRIFVEKQSGKLQVINAQLPHFSRYGFGRIDG